MALNRTKVLEAAQKHLQKGQHDKAIAEYQKLVKEDPRDVRTLLKIGDLFTRTGKKDSAIETYNKVAEQYANQGFFLKAVAVYKQILKLDADQLDISEKLAAMYEELALISDALNTYEQVADGYARAGNADKAIATMEKMVGLDPDNIAVRIKFAETVSRADRPKEAAAAFASGAALLKEQGRMDDYIRVAERQLYHQADNLALALELATLYLERRDAKRALAKLQVCFKDNPRDIQTLEMLAEAFRQLGQGTKTISVLREIARIHQEMNANEPRRRALSRILDLDPDDAEARDALGVAARGDHKLGATMIDERSPEQRAEAKAQRESVRPEPASDEADLLEDDEFDDDLLMDEDDDEVMILDDEDSATAAVPQEPEPETADERISRLMAEADIKEAAGLWLEVEGLLKEVLELNADEVPARERLKDLYLELEREADAVTELLLLADAWAGTDTDRAIGYAQHAARLAPGDQRAQLRLEALGALAEDDPLARPIEDDFGGPKPDAGAHLSNDQMDALLDAPISDDFGAPEPAPPAGRLSKNTMTDALPRPSDVEGLLEGAIRTSHPPAMAEDASAGGEQDEFDPLEAPIEDDFGAPAAKSDVNALLDAPIEDDFGAPAAAAESETDAEFDPLDAPIEDDFGAPPVSSIPAAPAADVDALLDAPIEDDFATPAASVSVNLDSVDAMLDAPIDDSFAGADATDASASPDELPDLDDLPDLPGVDSVEFSDVATGEVELYDDEAADAGPGSIHDEPTSRGEFPEDVQLSGDDPATVEAELPSETMHLAGSSESLAPTPMPPAPEEAVPEVEIQAAAEAEVEQDPVEAEAVPPEVDEAIDEADFFFQQGMLEDAVEAIQEALGEFPGSAALEAKLAEYQAAGEAQKAAQSEAPAEGSDAAFKLAEQLASEITDVAAEAPPENVDVEQVFAQFKKGVAEQIGSDDSATHFDLGIAYKEMGLIDDSIGEFRTAATDPTRTCNALTMIGMCLMEQGKHADAITEFTAAINCEIKETRANLGLHYEIGAAHEAKGDIASAIEHFEQTAAEDPTFRGVKARLEQLKAGAKPEGESVDTGDGDDLDRAFDDLMGDSE